MSERKTVTLYDQHLDQIAAAKDRLDDDEPGESAAVREVFDQAAEADELEQQVDELRNRVDELRDQLAAANTRIDAANELVRYVEEEREVRRRQRSLEEQRATAGLGRRLKWMVTGMPTPDAGDVDAES